MNKSDVIDLLKEHQNKRGIENWMKLGNELKSYGVGLTVLRNLAKQIGRDRALAADLWKSDVYEAKLISLLIDDPKTMTRQQAEAQVEELEGGYLAHVFASCDATLAKTSFVIELLSDWIESDDMIRRLCGYGLLYEVAKSKKKSALDDDFFLKRISQMEQSFEGEDPSVNQYMGIALVRIGMRQLSLSAKVIRPSRADSFSTSSSVKPALPFVPVSGSATTSSPS